MDGTHAAFLLLGGHPQRRLQARARGYQPVSWRLEQPDRRNAAAGRAGGHGGDREDLPRSAQPAHHSREPHAQHPLPGQRGAAQAHLQHGRSECAHRLHQPRCEEDHHRHPAAWRHGDAGAGDPQQAPHRPQGFRSLHHLAQQRPVLRRAGHRRGAVRAIPAAAPACRLERAPQEPPFPELRGSGQALRQAAGHRSLADQPAVRAQRRHRLRQWRGHGRPGRAGRCAAGQGAPQVQGIRHQGKAVCHRQGRQRHLWHGRDDRARRPRNWPSCRARAATRWA